MTIRITVATLIALAALVFAAPGAERSATEAAYPGTNGRISFVIGQVGGYSIHTMNPDGTDIAFVDFEGSFLFGSPVAAPVWSPDGSEIAYYALSQPGPGIHVTSADGSESRVVPNTEDAFFFVTWSPDGSRLAFSETVDGGLDIFTIVTDGSNKTRITNTPGEIGAYLQWSPNGEKIALATSRSGSGWDIEVIDADGSNRLALTDTPGVSEIRPSWSPDGEHIIFEQSPAGAQYPSEIIRVDADGLNRTIFTGTDHVGRQPAYSPDGQKIVYFRAGGENPGIVVMDSDGGNEVVINGAYGGFPDWGTHPVTTPTEFIWGDANCSGGVDPVDALLTMRFDGGLPTDTGDCPDMGDVVEIVDASPHPWGDVDCSGSADPIDSLKLLRNDAGLSVSQTGNCPLIGSEVQLAGS